MIRTEDAIAVARSMLGTPYSTYDCINFIKAIIRKAPGGDPKYTDAHVPALWASYESSGKYKHLVWRRENLGDPKPGMIAFKGKPLGYDHEPSHVGLVTSPTTVIHSSSAKGCVVETDLLNGQWTLLAGHRLIEVDSEEKREDEDMDSLYKAKVVTQSGGLNLRQGPSTSDGKIAVIPKGEIVDVIKELSGGWDYVSSSVGIGYASSQYLEKVAVPDEPDEPEVEPDTGWLVNTTLVSSAGELIILPGRWRIAED